MACVFNKFLKSTLKVTKATYQVRFYARWSHRRPLKVYTPEEYENIEKRSDDKKPEQNVFAKYGGLKTSWSKPKDDKQEINYQIKAKKTHKPLIATTQKSKVIPSTDMLETVIDQDGNFIYTKMKNNDQRVGKILTDLKSNKEKGKDLILLEGKRIIKDALQSGCQLKYLLFSRKDEVEYLKPFLPKASANLYKMPYREMQMWSDLTTTPGIMGIFKTPNLEDTTLQHSLPITIICDNIREPGNLGSILRVSAAVGCEKVILTKGCVNLWDSKVLRSSVGAHFKLRIRKNMDWNEIGEIVGEDANFFIADNKFVLGEDPEDLVNTLDRIPLLPYYGVDFRNSKHLVLVVGGETVGISKDSYELAVKCSGARLHIPLSNEIDSLNVGAALGVIAFEMKKQLTEVLVNK